MRFQISNICLHGFYKRQSRAKNIRGNKKTLQRRFDHSNIFIYPKSLFISISKVDARNLFLKEEKKLWKRIKQELEIEFDEKISHLTLKVVNIHCFMTINISPSEILHRIVPHLKEQFGVKQIEITQEANCPFPIQVDNILRKGKEIGSFINFNVKIPDPTLKKQYSVKFMKTAVSFEKTNVTLILTTLSPVAKKAILFFEQLKNGRSSEPSE